MYICIDYISVQELDIEAIHPLTDKPIPIYVHNNYVFTTQSKTHVGMFVIDLEKKITMINNFDVFILDVYLQGSCLI